MRIYSSLAKWIFGLCVMACLYGTLISCSDSEEYSRPRFKVETTGDFEIIGEELEDASFANKLWVCGDYIIVHYLGLTDPTCVHVFDKKTGKPVLDALRRGRGANEILWTQNSAVDSNTGEVTFYDFQQNARLTFSIDSLLKFGSSVIHKSNFTHTKCVTNILPYSDDAEICVTTPSFLTKDDDIEPRISLRDSNGNVLAKYEVFPELDRKTLHSCYTFPSAAISPDGSKLALAIYWGAILETFSVSRGTIERRAIKRFIKPEFTTNDMGSIRYTENSYAGFQTLTAKDDFIYAVYDGEVNLFENSKLPKDKKMTFSRNIAVFDWDGKPLKKIRTDYTIYAIDVIEEESSKVLYAFVEDKERHYFLGKMNI